MLRAPLEIGARLEPATVRIRGAWGDQRWCGLVLELSDATVRLPDPGACDDDTEDSFGVSSQMPPVFRRPGLCAGLHEETDDDDALTDAAGTFETEVCLATARQAPSSPSSPSVPAAPSPSSSGTA